MDLSPSKKPKPPIPKSKYEMNLAEFPLAFLTTKIPKGTEALEYQDTIIGKNGQEIPRHWKVYRDGQHGFPTTSTQATLFELFQIWARTDFSSPTIRFGSIYELIKRRGLAHADSDAYERIRRDLGILVGIKIEARNAFWDNEKKAYVDKTFHLFESVTFYRREGVSRQQVLPFAYIEASKELWGSIEANTLLTLRQVDSEFFHSLTPTQQRLALYLGKMLYAASEHWRDVLQLGRQIPILAKNYKDIKKQLTKACDGLLVKEFPYLTAYHYERKRDGKGENIVFSRKGIKEHPEVKLQLPEVAQEPDFEKARRDLLVQDIISVNGDGHRSRAFYQLVAQKLDEQTIRRALSETKDADRSGEIRTTRGKFFTDLIKRYAAEQGITLNPKKREGGGPSV